MDLKNIIRWLLVLPAAIAGYFAPVIFGTIMLSLLESGCLSHPEPVIDPPLWKILLDNFPLILPLITATLGAYLFIFAGAKTAPNRKFVVAVILAVIIFGFVVGVGLLLPSKFPVWAKALEVISVLAVSIIACVQQYRKEQEMRI